MPCETLSLASTAAHMPLGRLADTEEHADSQSHHSSLWAWIWLYLLSLACATSGAPSAHLELLLPAVSLHAPDLSSSTILGFCTHMARASNHGIADWWPKASHLPECLQFVPTLAVCSGFHHYMYAWNQSLPLHGYLQMFSLVQCVHTTSSSHHNCLPWCPATLVSCWGHHQPLRPPWICFSVLQGRCSCWCCGPQWPEPTSHHAPWTWTSHISLHLMMSTTR